MRVAVLTSSFGFFVLLLIVGLITVATELTAATLPSVLTGFTTYGPVALAAMTLGAIGYGLISVFSEGLNFRED